MCSWQVYCLWKQRSMASVQLTARQVPCPNSARKVPDSPNVYSGHFLCPQCCTYSYYDGKLQYSKINWLVGLTSVSTIRLYRRRCHTELLAQVAIRMADENTMRMLLVGHAFTRNIRGVKRYASWQLLLQRQFGWHVKHIKNWHN